MLDCMFLTCSAQLSAAQVGDGKVHFIKFYAPWCGE